MRLFTNLVTHEYEMLLNPISPRVELSFPKRQTGGSRQIGQGGCQSCKTSSHKQEHFPTRASWKSISERSAVDLSSGVEIRNGWMARKPKTSLGLSWTKSPFNRGRFWDKQMHREERNPLAGSGQSHSPANLFHLQSLLFIQHWTTIVMFSLLILYHQYDWLKIFRTRWAFEIFHSRFIVGFS